MGYIFDPPRFMTQLNLGKSIQSRSTSQHHRQTQMPASPENQSELLLKRTLKAPTAVISPAPTIDISLTEAPTTYTIHSNKVWYRSRPAPSRGSPSKHLALQSKQTVK